MRLRDVIGSRRRSPSSRPARWAGLSFLAGDQDAGVARQSVVAHQGAVQRDILPGHADIGAADRSVLDRKCSPRPVAMIFTRRGPIVIGLLDVLPVSPGVRGAA